MFVMQYRVTPPSGKVVNRRYPGWRFANPGYVWGQDEKKNAHKKPRRSGVFIYDQQITLWHGWQ